MDGSSIFFKISSIGFAEEVISIRAGLLKFLKFKLEDMFAKNFDSASLKLEVKNILYGIKSFLPIQISPSIISNLSKVWPIILSMLSESKISLAGFFRIIFITSRYKFFISFLSIINL